MKRAPIERTTTEQTAIEPGLYLVFRLLIGVKLLWAFSRLIFNPQSLNTPLAALVEFGPPLFLLVYLWPSRHRQLGRAFLPIGFAIILVTPLINDYMQLIMDVNSERLDTVQFVIMMRAAIEIALTAVIIGWHYRWRIAVVATAGAMVVDSLIRARFVTSDSWLYPNRFFMMVLVIFPIGFVTIGGMMAWFMNRQQDQKRALAAANDQIARYATTIEQLAISQERNRMARELHDTLAHSLSGATVQQEAVLALWDDDPTAARAMLDRSLQTTRTGLLEARRALEELRAVPLDDLGLVLALERLAKEMAQRANLTLHCALPERLQTLSPTVEQCIYRVAQEGMTNVVRHAKAATLTLCLSQANDQLRLTIADDGVGFNPTTLPQERFGLQGMRERAEMIGGHLAIESAPDQGTMVRLTLPLTRTLTGKVGGTT